MADITVTVSVNGSEFSRATFVNDVLAYEIVPDDHWSIVILDAEKHTYRAGRTGKTPVHVRMRELHGAGPHKVVVDLQCIPGNFIHLRVGATRELVYNGSAVGKFGFNGVSWDAL